MAKKKRSEAQEAKRFGVILGVALAALGGWLFWRGRPEGAYISWGIGGLALVLSLLLGSLWLRFFKLWMKLAEGLSWVMTRVILSIFFFLILTPVGLLMRLLGKRPLDVKFRDGKPTYWVDKPENESTVERYRKVY